MPFCPDCGREYRQPANFCNRCGRALPAIVSRESAVAAATPLELPYAIYPGRIILMAALTFGFYLFYWFYLTWKQYRDYTGNEAYPVWHALTLFVPIYNLFRLYAHASTYHNLMRDTGSPGGIKAWLAVVLALIAGTLAFAAFSNSLSPGALTQDGAVGIVIFSAIAIGAIIALLLHLQSNLNRYWQSRPNGRVSSAPVGFGELIIGIVGAVTWLRIFSESFS